MTQKTEEWVGDGIRLKKIGKATEQLPDQYFLLALSLLLTGRINESADLKCATHEELTMQEILGSVRNHTNKARVDLAVRKRTDVQVDQATYES